MESLEEKLQELEEDGLQYAHFFTHPAHPGYYGIMVRVRTPEYIRMWLPYGPLKDYSLQFSLPVDDADFLEYIMETYTDQVPVKTLQALCRIDNLENPEILLPDFLDWKLEQERQQREEALQQYPWQVTPERKAL